MSSIMISGGATVYTVWGQQMQEIPNSTDVTCNTLLLHSLHVHGDYL